jgi:hypothetical protein
VQTRFDKGVAAYQQQLIQRGFLGGDSVSAVDVSVGRED